MTTQPQQRSAHPYHMYDAIKGQPDAISRILEEESATVAEAVALASHAEQLHIVGIGTSWHAALVGEHLLRTLSAREDCRAWNSFEFVGAPPPLSPRDAVIVLSHRGTKQYSLKALELAQRAGTATILVTGIGSKARADLADVVIRTCPEERSSAFTISHTSAITVLTMLAVQLAAAGGESSAAELKSQLAQLPKHVASAMDQEPSVTEWAKSATGAVRHYFAGWGPNASTAYEVALKIKESSYVTTEGFHLEQYLHGPFVTTEPGTMVTFIAPPGYGHGRSRELIEAANAVGAHTVGLLSRGDEELAPLVGTSIFLPHCADFLTPIVYLVPLQLFTYWLAVELGSNPDLFRLDNASHLAAKEKYTL